MSVPTFPANAIGAPCREESPELFFPQKDAKPARVNPARKVCRSGCDYFDECLSYALRNKVEGVWAATTENERVAIRKKHGIEAEPLSFGAGPTNTSAIKRMYRAGSELTTIARRLDLSFETVRVVVRAYEKQREAEGKPPRPAPTGRTNCADCGKEVGIPSLRKHRRDHCPNRQEVAS